MTFFSRTSFSSCFFCIQSLAHNQKKSSRRWSHTRIRATHLLASPHPLPVFLLQLPHDRLPSKQAVDCVKTLSNLNPSSKYFRENIAANFFLVLVPDTSTRVSSLLQITCETGIQSWKSCSRSPKDSPLLVLRVSRIAASARLLRAASWTVCVCV